MGSCCIAQEAQLYSCDDLEGGMGVGQEEVQEGWIYVYLWLFMLLNGRNQHNLVNDYPPI